jgi:GNAT superfamily N-acetyltransferase
MTEIAPRPKPFSQKPFRIAREAPEDGMRTREALAAEVAAEFGPRDEEAFALTARDETGGWIGGINGVIHWRWLYIAQFFVAPGWRGQGLGRTLLAETEALAREKNCVGLYLDTFSPRALTFYRANGFEIAGKIANFPPGAARTFLHRAFTPASA